MPEGIKKLRWKRESNPCARFCRPLPHHSAIPPWRYRLTQYSAGADDETRTRDPHLGKVMRYQLRYIRIAPQTFIPLRCEKKHYRAPRQFPNPQPSALLLTADIPRLYVPKSHRCDSCGPRAPSRLPLMSSPTQPIRYLNFKRCTFSHRTVL